MRISSILSHWRRVIYILAFATALIAAIYSPPPVTADPARCEEMGCVEWSAEKGCTATMFCCVFNDGGVMCWRNGVLVTD